MKTNGRKNVFINYYYLSNYIRRPAYKCDFPEQSQVFFIAESSVVVVTFVYVFYSLSFFFKRDDNLKGAKS